MWPWRDWVIDAFNRNMPFDQFTIEQLAGDLLPNATLATEDRHRLQPQPHDQLRRRRDSGGVSRTSTSSIASSATATTWLGMTMGCARCHDHKYDPITQKDFYRFFAFFNTVPEKGPGRLRGECRAVSASCLRPSKQQQLDDLESRRSRALDEHMPRKMSLALRNEWQKTALAMQCRSRPRDGLTAHYAFRWRPGRRFRPHHDGKARSR